MSQGGGRQRPYLSGVPEVLSSERGWWMQGEGISVALQDQKRSGLGRMVCGTKVETVVGIWMSPR